MQLSRDRLEQLHTHMQELATYTSEQESITKKNIIGTNRVIYIFTLIGMLLTLLIFFMFSQLSREIEHSVASMQTMQNQAVTLQKTVMSLTNTIENMGFDVEQLYYMNNSISQIADQTQLFEKYLGQITQSTQQLSNDSIILNQSAQKMDTTIKSINHSTGNISYSLHETAKPIKQFFPVP